MKTSIMLIEICDRSPSLSTRLEVPIFMYSLKNDPSSISERDMMTREY